MADALKFMIELVDKMSAPATRASLAVRSLDSNLIALKRTVGELAAMPAVKFPAPKMAGGGRRGADPNATGAMDMGGAKMAALAEKARKQQEKEAGLAAKAAQKQEAAESKAFDRRVKAYGQSLEKEKRLQEKAARQSATAAKKQAAAAKKAADAQKKAFEKTSGGAFAKAFGEANKASAGFDVLGTAAGALLNPVSLATIAIAGMAAALAGLAGLLFRGAELAIAASEAKNDTLDMLEAMLGTRDAADSTYSALSAMTGDLAATQEGLAMSAQELSASGVESQKRLLESVKAIAQVDSVLKGSGAKVQGIIEKAAQTGKFEVSAKQLASTGVQTSALYAELGKRLGIGVKDVEAQLKSGKISAEDGIDALNSVLSNKFGALAAKQAKDFGAQMQRMKDNFGKLFEDVDTGPFLDGLDSIVKLLDSSTETGKALKFVMTSVFDGLFNAASAVLPYIKIGLKGIVLIALKVWNAMLPLRSAIAAAFGGETQNKQQSFMDSMVTIANVIGEVTAKVVGLITQKGVWESIIFFVESAVFAFKTLWNTLTFLVGAFVAVESAVISIITWVANLGTAVVEVGASIMTGLIQVLSNPSRLYEVVTNLATGALGKFKSVFGIASPSKVMMGLGGNITAGLAQGIDKGAKAANDNMGNVISLESARARAETPVAAPVGTGGGSSVVIQISEGAIQINGTNMTAAEVKELFPEMFVDAVERMGLAQGAGEKVA